MVCVTIGFCNPAVSLIKYSISYRRQTYWKSNPHKARTQSLFLWKVKWLVRIVCNSSHSTKLKGNYFANSSTELCIIQASHSKWFKFSWNCWISPQNYVYDIVQQTTKKRSFQNWANSIFSVTLLLFRNADANIAMSGLHKHHIYVAIGSAPKNMDSTLPDAI